MQPKTSCSESGQSKEYADGKNSNAGAQVGVGVSVGAQTGVYVYAEAGYGKGSNHLESTTHNNTTLNADQISIKSQGDTTLKGAQATANRIDADVGGNLNIISQQDTLEQKNKQMGVGARVQVSAGTAWDASGNFNNSSAAGNSKAVLTNKVDYLQVMAVTTSKQTMLIYKVEQLPLPHQKKTMISLLTA